MELLEVVPNEPEHSAYKLLAGRLYYNAGLKVAVLEEVFAADRKTMRLWGRALRSRDPEQLQRVLLGREACRKRTAAVEAYAGQRWPQLQAQGCRDYRKKLGEEIQRIFQVRLSGESLRLSSKKFKESAAAEVKSSSMPAAAEAKAVEAAGSRIQPEALRQSPLPAIAQSMASEVVEWPLAVPGEGPVEVAPEPLLEEKGFSKETAPAQPGASEAEVSRQFLKWYRNLLDTPAGCGLAKLAGEQKK